MQAKDDYLLRYMLDVESRGSLLSVEGLKKPFDYKLNIALDSAGAFEPRKVDLVETFNYLIGLRIKRIDAQPQRGFVTVTGNLPSGESCLVLWRDCENIDYDELRRMANRLDIEAANNPYAVIYINGDHDIPASYTPAEGEDAAGRALRRTCAWKKTWLLKKRYKSMTYMGKTALCNKPCNKPFCCII